MRRTATVLSSVLLVLALAAGLCSCEGCKGKKPGALKEDEKAFAKSLPDSGPKPPIVYPTPEELKKTEAAARREFENSFAQKPRDPKTWQKFLRVCESRARAEEPQAAECYNRFFEQTKDIEFDDAFMAQAYRWRTILALQQDNAPEALFYYSRLEALEEKLVKEGRLAVEIQAYSAFIHAGVLRLKGRIDEAVAELQRAIGLYDQGPRRDPRPVEDYLMKLAEYAYEAENLQLSAATLTRLEERLKQRYGDIHIAVAATKLKKINVLLDIGDKAGARSEWNYVKKVIGKTPPHDLPKEIDNLYSRTMVLLDMHGLL